MISEFQGEYRFLSNFWPSTVMLKGEAYKSVEHAYQAAKTLDKRERRTVRSAFSPGDAKRAGRLVTLRPDWEQIKVRVMCALVTQKFMQPVLLQQLLDTGEEVLQEGNKWGDTFWGIDLKTGRGQNMLGAILMDVRNIAKYANV